MTAEDELEALAEEVLRTMPETPPENWARQLAESFMLSVEQEGES